LVVVGLPSVVTGVRLQAAVARRAAVTGSWRPPGLHLPLDPAG